MSAPTARPPASTTLSNEGAALDASDGIGLLVEGELVAGTYEVKTLLGEGGRGQVWEAQDKSLNRKVALKIVPLSDGGAIRREAQAIATIRHPAMTVVHSLGQHRGMDFLVMERLHGVTMEAFLAAHRDHATKRTADALAEAAPRETVPSGVPGATPVIPVEEALRILLAVADGLGAVHRAGIAHGDVKPSNIMLTSDHRVVIVDFGLFLAQTDASSRRNMAGTPLYMAPELITANIARGEGHLVDLYALGIMMFELFVGRVPFDGPNIASVWKQHVAAEVPDLALLRPDLPPVLTALVHELLAKDPKERPQSVDDVVLTLSHARTLIGTQTGAMAPSFSVLVVDDDPDIARVISFYVKHAVPDADIRVASDGIRALTALRQRNAHLMLLDLQMPRMNGIEVCMFLRGSGVGENCSIVCVSAGAQATDVELLRHMGVTKFVPKGDPSLNVLIRDVVQEAHRRVVGAVKPDPSVL